MEKHGRLECPACGSGRVGETTLDGPEAQLTGKATAAKCKDCGNSWTV